MPCLIAFLVSACPPAAADDGEHLGRPLRIVTYNLLHDGPTSGFFDGHTHLEERLAMVIRELKRLDPDIVAVQEASSSRRHGNVPERLAQALGLNFVFAPATEHVSGLRLLDRFIVGAMGFAEGSAILSRFRIVASHLYDLPRCRSRLEPRILLEAELATEWGPLSVFSTHTARGDDCQLKRVGDIVRERTDAGPSLLAGDFNTPETSHVLTMLRNEAGFIDAFRSANPDQDGPTVWQRIESPQATVSRRVDFVLVLNGREATATVRASRVALNQPGRLPDGTILWPSDHYGVLAELDMTPARQAAQPAR